MMSSTSQEIANRSVMTVQEVFKSSLAGAALRQLDKSIIDSPNNVDALTLMAADLHQLVRESNNPNAADLAENTAALREVGPDAPVCAVFDVPVII